MNIHSIDNYNDIVFWQRLIPNLRIGNSKTQEPIDVDSNRLAIEKLRFNQDGYFNFDNFLPKENVSLLKSSAIELDKLGIPPLFLILYDEFWELVKLYEDIVHKILSPTAKMLPDVWVWVIDPNEEEAGWPPHRDGNPCELKSKDVLSITTWVSLSMANADNGHIFVLPQSKDRGYPDRILMNANDLQNIRGIHTSPGSVIGWHQSLLHWGGRANTFATEPRVSFAVEFSPKGCSRIMDTRSFNSRLELAFNQIANYSHISKIDRKWPDFYRLLSQHRN